MSVPCRGALQAGAFQAGVVAARAAVGRLHYHSLVSNGRRRIQILGGWRLSVVFSEDSRFRWYFTEVVIFQCYRTNFPRNERACFCQKRRTRTGNITTQAAAPTDRVLCSSDLSSLHCHRRGRPAGHKGENNKTSCLFQKKISSTLARAGSVMNKVALLPVSISPCVSRDLCR